MRLDALQRRMKVLQTDEVPSYIDLKIIVMDPYRVRTGCNHALLRRLRIFGQRDKLKTDRFKRI
jgi:hypothetical protein